MLARTKSPSARKSVPLTGDWYLLQLTIRGGYQARGKGAAGPRCPAAQAGAAAALQDPPRHRRARTQHPPGADRRPLLTSVLCPILLSLLSALPASRFFN